MAGTLKFDGWADGEIHVKNLRGQERQPLFSLLVLQMSVLMLQVQGVVKNYATPQGPLTVLAGVDLHLG